METVKGPLAILGWSILQFVFPMKYWPYLSLQYVLGLTFLALIACLDLFPQVFPRANWSPQIFSFLRTNWTPLGSRSYLSKNLNHYSGPELLMIFFIVTRYMWQILVIHSFKRIRLLSIWRMDVKSMSWKDWGCCTEIDFLYSWERFPRTIVGHCGAVKIKQTSTLNS